MAQDSWPSPGHNSREVTDSEYERVAQRFSDDGVYGSPTGAAVVTAGAGLSVDVAADVAASLRGHAWYSGATADNLTITANASGSTRVDWVALRLDRSDWSVRAVVRAGTPGAGAPALVQDQGSSGVFEIPLATVTVLNGASTVTVTRAEQYVGSRVRPCTSTTVPLTPQLGEQAFETDTGILRMWTGSAWVIVYQDSGEVALGTGFAAWTPSGSSVGRLLNGIVCLRIAKKLTGSSLAVTDADGSKVATVPPALRPLNQPEYFGAQFSGGHAARVEVRLNGDIWVRAISETVPTNNELDLTMTYIRR
ncbi:hypothetical protein [Streptomyces soliscabiei]|uniref:hypothetical protein n=1 Tax=Streptomyces soliscabiei TaxID=588897 RepID=UPI0029B05C19|nr:hypothetical protein [Streptomyces sp. NY05-11A]MDX2681113.1 hypothetical protein [Streptomyces sp. NY05-11A]